MAHDVSVWLQYRHVFFGASDEPATFSYVAVAIAEPLSCRSTRFHPAGGVIVLPAGRTITWATITSPLVVPAGSPMVSVGPPPLLLPMAAARSAIPDGGVGVGVGVAVGLVMVKESVKLLGAVEPVKFSETVS